jgi:poly(hydroxyalkanoate) depolymerase family esterase
LGQASQQEPAPVLSLKKTIASLTHNRRRWDALMRAAKPADAPQAGPTRLEEVSGFGSNPGNLRMFSYVPQRLAGEPALVVVLHGCTQTAAGYDLGAGWSTLAERYGFALLVPEQRQANNPKRCFNWFVPGDTRRDRGEALSIRQMIETMVVDKGIDRRRVFVTGLSAGGAMTSVMLACYPEVFAGGAIIAGLPYGAATNVQEAFESMFQSPSRPAPAWGDLVRGAAPHTGSWPRISVWHGSADKTVVPANAQEILKQWTDVHGLPLAPSRETIVDGYPRKVWLGPAGEELIESYTITNMAHGTPLATGAADAACGAAGPFLLEVGISSSYHIAKFFGLTAGVHAAAPTWRERVTIAPQQPAAERLEPARAEPGVLYGDVLDPEPEEKPEHGRAAQHGAIDIGAVIAKALTAAGLMKSR